jgi:hypothetical protein
MTEQTMGAFSGAYVHVEGLHMSKGIHTFKQGDVAKALKAAHIAGVTVDRYEIDRVGKIVVFLATAAIATPEHESV